MNYLYINFIEVYFLFLKLYNTFKFVFYPYHHKIQYFVFVMIMTDKKCFLFFVKTFIIYNKSRKNVSVGK